MPLSVNHTTETILHHHRHHHHHHHLYNGNKVEPLNIMLPKTSAYVTTYYGQTKWMHLFIEDDGLLKKCNTSWNKVSTDIEKEFNSEPVYNKEFLKTKIKSHSYEVTDFFDEKVSKVGFNHTCLAVVNLILHSRKMTIIIRKHF